VKSVLIVEDSATTRAMMKAVIEDMGEDFATLEADTGFEALKLLPWGRLRTVRSWKRGKR
jgi:CheY-like chemotaxis protein